jgi:predicted lipoprotein with Yx(FWY)xxD motif
MNLRKERSMGTDGARLTTRMRWIGVAGAAMALLLAACAKSTAATSGGKATVASKKVSPVGTVLVNAEGFTLYHLKTETSSDIQCTGACAGTWPPVLLPAGVTAPTEASGVTGKLGTVTRPDGGTQVTYNGFPLYTYSGDTGPGQANGQGIQNVWFAVTATGSGSSGGTGTGGGYGGY